MRYTTFISSAIILFMCTVTLISQQPHTIDIPGQDEFIYYVSSVGSYGTGSNSLLVGLKEQYLTCRSYIIWHNIRSFVPLGSVVTDVKFYITWLGPGASTAQVEFRDFTFGANTWETYANLKSGELWGTVSATTIEYSFTRLTEEVQNVVDGGIGNSVKIGISNQDEASLDDYVYYQYLVSLRVSYFDGDITVTQIDDQGNPFGQVGRWIDDDWDWIDVPFNLQLLAGSDLGLKSNQEFKTGTYQKYWKWTQNSNDYITNHHNFTVLSGINMLRATFKSTDEGITIKNEILEAPGLNPADDFIQYKDPWFIDYPDPQFPNPQGGYYRRNQGMEAVYRARSAPFYPNYNDPYEYNQPYKGIFLDQNSTFDPNLPIYSVKTEPHNITLYNTGNLSGRLHRCYFRNWSYDPNKISLQNNTSQTAVVFKTTDAALTANLKGTQLSNELTAYDNNSQRKFVRTDNGNLHLSR